MYETFESIQGWAYSAYHKAVENGVSGPEANRIAASVRDWAANMGRLCEQARSLGYGPTDAQWPKCHHEDRIALENRLIADALRRQTELRRPAAVNRYPGTCICEKHVAAHEGLAVAGPSRWHVFCGTACRQQWEDGLRRVCGPLEF